MVTTVDVLNFFHAPIILTHIHLSTIDLELTSFYRLCVKSNKSLSSSTKIILECNPKTVYHFIVTLTLPQIAIIIAGAHQARLFCTVDAR